MRRHKRVESTALSSSAGLRGGLRLVGVIANTGLTRGEYAREHGGLGDVLLRSNLPLYSLTTDNGTTALGVLNDPRAHTEGRVSLELCAGFTEMANVGLYYFNNIQRV